MGHLFYQVEGLKQPVAYAIVQDNALTPTRAFLYRVRRQQSDSSNTSTTSTVSSTASWSRWSSVPVPNSPTASSEPLSNLPRRPQRSRTPPNGSFFEGFMLQKQNEREMKTDKALPRVQRKPSHLDMQNVQLQKHAVRKSPVLAKRKGRWHSMTDGDESGREVINHSTISTTSRNEYVVTQDPKHTRAQAA